jgi:hypothetical protein
VQIGDGFSRSWDHNAPTGGSMPIGDPTGWMWSDACDKLDQRRVAGCKFSPDTLGGRGEKNYQLHYRLFCILIERGKCIAPVSLFCYS